MRARYRVVHQRKSIWEAMFSGRSFTDWYIAQERCWWGWRELGVFKTVGEAEHACEEHAGGRLLRDGGRVVSEFSGPE